jgi:ACS family 4-hydroxyphenylacetate permease-like MFS transporter
LIAIEVNLGRQMFNAGIFMVAGFLVLGALIIAFIPMSKTQPQNAAAPLST